MKFPVEKRKIPFSKCQAFFLFVFFPGWMRNSDLGYFSLISSSSNRDRWEKIKGQIPTLPFASANYSDQTPSWKGIPPPNPLNSGLAICSDVGLVPRLVCITLMVKSCVFDTSDPGKISSF